MQIYIHVRYMKKEKVHILVHYLEKFCVTLKSEEIFKVQMEDKNEKKKLLKIGRLCINV